MHRRQTAPLGTVIAFLLSAKATALAQPQVVSPVVGADRRVTFKLRAPQARAVTVNAPWSRQKVAMTKDGDGIWTTSTGPLAPGIYEYSYDIDGLTTIDPANPNLKPQRSPTASILEIPGDPALVTEYRDVPHGTVHIHEYRSKTLSRVRRLHVYTPPGYDRKGAGPFPTLYLFHGRGDNDATWTVFGRAHLIVDNLLADAKVRPMVMVMTDGHALTEGARTAEAMGANTDAFGRELLEEVMPLVEATYRVKRRADARAIMGLSMGGQQALTVGLRNPDKFAWVVGFSSAPPTEAALEGALVDPAALGKRLRLLWIGCGKDDFLLKRNEAMIATLKDKGVPHTWRLTDGDHSWPVWRRYLAEVAPALFTDSPRR